MKNCAVESALDGAATVSFLGFLTDMTGRNCSVLQRKAERTSSIGRLLKSRREREEIETILWKETKKLGYLFFILETVEGLCDVGGRRVIVDVLCGSDARDRADPFFAFLCHRRLPGPDRDSYSRACIPCYPICSTIG